MNFDIKWGSFNKKDIGKLISSSKSEYKWDFSVNGTGHQVKLANSSFSGKVRVWFDGNQVHYVKKNSSERFYHQWFSGPVSVEVLSGGDEFTIKVSGMSFGSKPLVDRNRIF
jgi:hypothetical protein